MPEVYQQVTDDAGEVTYVVVEEDQLPSILTDEQVRQTSAYKLTLDESVSRRKTITRMKEEAAALEAQLVTDDDADDDADDTVVADDDNDELEPAPVLTVEELTERVIDSIQQQTAALLEEEVVYKARIDKLLTDHKLAEEARPVLEGSSNPDETAEYIGRLGTQFDDVTGGAMPTSADAVESMMQRVENKLGLNDT